MRSAGQFHRPALRALICISYSSFSSSLPPAAVCCLFRRKEYRDDRRPCPWKETCWKYNHASFSKSFLLWFASITKPSFTRRGTSDFDTLIFLFFRFFFPFHFIYRSWNSFPPLTCCFATIIFGAFNSLQKNESSADRKWYICENSILLQSAIWSAICILFIVINDKLSHLNFSDESHQAIERLQIFFEKSENK